MSGISDQYRGEDTTLEAIRTKADEIRKQGALTGAESWNDACDFLHKQMLEEGLETTAAEILGHMVDECE